MTFNSVKLINTNLSTGNVFKDCPVNEVIVNCKLDQQYIDIIKQIEKVKKINKSFVETPILNQLSYEVQSDRLKSLNFKFNGDLFSTIKKTIKKLDF